MTQKLVAEHSLNLYDTIIDVSNSAIPNVFNMVLGTLWRNYQIFPEKDGMRFLVFT
ncbi:MAG: hypothetical protein HQ517_05140 [SAR324 cluster bacterium]|nr:hypothetical protein [SAR324 cluster bacterium]